MTYQGFRTRALCKIVIDGDDVAKAFDPRRNARRGKRARKSNARKSSARRTRPKGSWSRVKPKLDRCDHYRHSSRPIECRLST